MHVVEIGKAQIMLVLGIEQYRVAYAERERAAMRQRPWRTGVHNQVKAALAGARYVAVIAYTTVRRTDTMDNGDRPHFDGADVGVEPACVAARDAHRIDRFGQYLCIAVKTPRKCDAVGR